MTVTQRNQNTPLAPLFGRTSIRNPSTIERQMVCFSFPILCSELLQFSLYLTSDRITPLNPAERQSSRFYAPLYTESPATINAQFFDNGTTNPSLTRVRSLSPSSIYLANDRRTALESAKRRSGASRIESFLCLRADVSAVHLLRSIAPR